MAISSKKLYELYVKNDEAVNVRGEGHRPFYFADEVKRYLKLLRKREYLFYKLKTSKSRSIRGVVSLYNKFLQYKMHKLGIKLGFNIPLNVAGPGLRIDHWGFLAINNDAKIGKNCHIFGDVTIGVKDNQTAGAPIIGDNVTIGAGARIIGPITIASNCVIGANAVVTRDFLKEGSVIAGIPAKLIK